MASDAALGDWWCSGGAGVTLGDLGWPWVTLGDRRGSRLGHQSTLATLGSPYAHHYHQRPPSGRHTWRACFCWSLSGHLKSPMATQGPPQVTYGHLWPPQVHLWPPQVHLAATYGHPRALPVTYGHRLCPVFSGLCPLVEAIPHFNSLLLHYSLDNLL